MSLKDYFEEVKGVGILSTADDKGEVDAAIYATPHVIDEKTIAFIMRDRLSHHNVSKNPKACYLFIENSQGYVGKRLFLSKIREEKNSEQLYSMRRRKYKSDSSEDLFLVYFTIEEELPLICKDDLC